MKDWHPVSIIVMWLSIVVGLILLSAAISPIIYKSPMSIEKAKMFEDLLKAVINIICVFVGSKLQQQRDSTKDKP